MTGRHAELRGRVAVVTGGAKGIGEGIARRFVVEGMRVVVADIDADSLDNTATELAEHDGSVLPVVGDLARIDDIDRLFTVAKEEFGTIDVLVNNAADLTRRTTLDRHDDLLAHQLAVNVSAPYLCSQRAAEIMKEAGRGSIVNISSVGALRAHHRGLPYDVTKGAVNAMTQAMAIDLGRHGIRVNGVGPGLTHTYRAANADPEILRTLADQVPLGRSGLVSELAAVVAFLASDEASYLTGQVVYVDGGLTAQLSPPSIHPL